MSKLILHIGTHKTATTSIQVSFEKSHELMRKNGLIYPILPKQQHGLVGDWVKLPKVYHYKQGAKVHWRHISQNHQGTNNTVIISSEELSRGTPGNRPDLSELREWTKEFDEVEVVCVLRDQVSLIQSVYLETMRNGNMLDWQKYFDGCLRNEMAVGVFLNYGKLYSDLLKNFDESEITFLPFRPKLGPTDPLETLLNHIGFANLLPNMHRANANESISPLATWIAVMLDRPEKFDPALARRIIPIFDNLKTTMFTAAEYEKVKAKFASLNVEFCSHYTGMTVDDLTFPNFDKGTHVFRNQITRRHWLKLAKTMRSVAN